MLLPSWPCQPCGCFLSPWSRSWWRWCRLLGTMSGTLTQVRCRIHTKSELVMDELKFCVFLSFIFSLSVLPKKNDTFEMQLACFYRFLLRHTRALPLFLPPRVHGAQPSSVLLPRHSPHILRSVRLALCSLSTGYPVSSPCLPASCVVCNGRMRKPATLLPPCLPSPLMHRPLMKVSVTMFGEVSA